MLPSTSGLNLGSATDRWDLFGVTGDFSSTLTVNGLTSLNGNTDLGNASDDNISINGRIDTNVIPDANVTYDLGSASLRWNNFYTNTIEAETLTINTGASFPDGVTFDGTTTFANIEVTGTANILSLEVSELVANGAAIVGTDATVTNTSINVIDSYPKSQSKGLKYIIQGEKSNNSAAVIALEIILAHNGTSVYYTRYGEIENGMGDVTITPVMASNGSHVDLQAVCSSASVANTHTFNIVRIETR